VTNIPFARSPYEMGIAEGVECMHRDLKSANNIMVSVDGDKVPSAADGLWSSEDVGSIGRNDEQRSSRHSGVYGA
jgi:hypothetical protein